MHCVRIENRLSLIPGLKGVSCYITVQNTVCYFLLYGYFLPPKDLCLQNLSFHCKSLWWRSFFDWNWLTIKIKRYNRLLLVVRPVLSSPEQGSGWAIVITCYQSSSVRPFTPLNDFSSVTPEPIFFKLHVEPSVKEELKIYTNGHGPLIKMAAMPIYGKNT